MMSTFDDPEFKKLKKEWYGKLEEIGFRDIETAYGQLSDHQTAYDFTQRIGFRRDFVEDIRTYYAWASEMSRVGFFESRTDEMIWLLHSEGKSCTDISHQVCLERTWVWRKIQRIRAYLQTQDPQEATNSIG